MKPADLAALLDGREYGNEITKDEVAQAKAAGLVVVFGYSDDNVELRGAIDEEIGAYEGTTLRITPSGLLPNFETLRDNDTEESEFEAHFQRKAQGFRDIKAVWAPPGIASSWVYETEIPHATFTVKEGEDTFCIGIVFALADVLQPAPPQTDPTGESLATWKARALWMAERIGEDRLPDSLCDRYGPTLNFKTGPDLLAAIDGEITKEADFRAAQGTLL